MELLTELNIDCIKVCLVKGSSNVSIGVRALGRRSDDVLLASRCRESSDLVDERSVVSRSTALNVEIEAETETVSDTCPN
jgi:hypothetical protein